MFTTWLGDSLLANYHYADMVHDSLLTISSSADIQGDSLPANYHPVILVHDSLFTINPSAYK